MKLFITLLFSLLLFACGPSDSGDSTTPSPSADDPSTDETSTAKGWKNTQTFYLSDRIEGNAIPEGLISAIDKWNDLLGASVFSYGGVTSHATYNSLYASLDDHKSVVFAPEDWAAQTVYGTKSKDPRTIATSVWNTDTDGYIYEADILLNANNYDFVDIAAEAPLSETEEDRFVSAEALLMHELGHCTGLNHRDEKSYYVGSTPSKTIPQIMNPYLPLGSDSVRTLFTQGDKDQLLEIYQERRPSLALSLDDHLYQKETTREKSDSGIIKKYHNQD